MASAGLAGRERAARRVMDGARALLGPAGFREAARRFAVPGTLDARLASVLRYLATLDPCLAHRCVQRAQRPCAATFEATSRCTCARAPDAAGARAAPPPCRSGSSAPGQDGASRHDATARGKRPRPCPCPCAERRAAQAADPPPPPPPPPGAVLDEPAPAGYTDPGDRPSAQRDRAPARGHAPCLADGPSDGVKGPGGRADCGELSSSPAGDASDAQQDQYDAMDHDAEIAPAAGLGDRASCPGNGDLRDKEVNDNDDDHHHNNNDNDNNRHHRRRRRSSSSSSGGSSSRRHSSERDGASAASGDCDGRPANRPCGSGADDDDAAAKRRRRDPRCCNRSKCDELVRACCDGDAARIDAWVAAKSGDVNGVGPKGQTALMLAARLGHACVVRSLLRGGAKLEIRDGAGRTAMAWATYACAPDVVAALAAAGADVNTRDVHGMTPLIDAAADGQTNLIALLLRLGANSSAVDASGLCALHHAAAAGHTNAVVLLAQRGVDLNLRCPEGCTALAIATRAGHGELALALLEVGADPLLPCKKGRSPMHLAARAGHAATLRAMLASARAGAIMRRNIDATCDRARSPLMYAAAHGRTECVKLILDLGADRTLADDCGRTALQLARRDGHTSSAKALLAFQSPFDQ